MDASELVRGSDKNLCSGPQTFGSLFAGIDGMGLGLERAGWECRWQVEIDPWCRTILERHWPTVPKYGDVKELTGYELEPVDLVAGGFPCQPVSKNGRRKAQADERWLWPHFARLLGVLRPRYVLLENVPGLLNANGGSAFGDVLGDLAALGFDAEWECVPASAIGAPHQRDRVFVVAYPNDSGRLHGQAQEHPAEAGIDALGQPEPSGTDVADTPSQGLSDGDACKVFGPGTVERLERCRSRNLGGQWAAEPEMGRVADGFPGRVDEIRGLGNAVVPQVAEFIGELLREAS